VFGRLRRNSQRCLDAGQQRFSVKWFGQERQVDIPTDDLAHVVAGHHDQLDSRPLLEQVGTQVRAVEAGHVDIGNCQIHSSRIRARKLQGLLAVRCGKDDAPICLQKKRDEIADQHFIVCNKNDGLLHAHRAGIRQLYVEVFK